MTEPTMMAAVIREHGGPDTIRYEEMRRPTPGPGEALIRVHATALNRLDLWARSGPPVKIFPWTEPDFPLISGSDCAGVVAEVGAGVTAVQPGDRVVLYPSLFCGRCEWCQRGEQTMCLEYRIFGEHTDGAMAEYAVAPAANLVRMPDHVSFVDAAALPVAYTTAWRMLGQAEMRAGDTVLVVGAGGPVGSAALTLARRAGARVLALAGTEEKRRLAIEHGASAAADHNAGPFSAWVMEQTAGRGADIVVDPLGATWQESIRSLTRGGRLTVCGATAGNTPTFDIRELYPRHRRIYGTPMGNWADFRRVTELLFRGEMRPIIDHVYPLSRVAEAHRRAETRQSFGKVVVTCAD